MRPVLLSVVSCALAACSSATNSPPLTPMTPASHDAFFPIVEGKHGGVDCDACHGEFDTFTRFSCVTCHAEHGQARIDSTHLGVVPGYAWTPTSCLACHPRGEAAAVDHARFFPIGPGAVHAGLSCSTCHTNPADRKVFDCVGCHQEAQTSSPASHITARHAAVPAYVWASASCYACHPDSTVPTSGVDHAAFFPIAPGSKHAGIACSTCHPNAADRKQIDCVSCHTAATTTPSHASVTGYEWSSRACYQCHPDATVTASVNHALFFPIAAGQRHAGISCATCHVDPARRQTVSCVTGCHGQTPTATEHTPVGGYTFSSTACLRCHADAQVDLVAQHLPFLIQSGSKHYRRSCLTCHPASRVDKPFGADFGRPKVACVGCHPVAEKDHFNQPALTCLNAGCHPDGHKR